MTSSPYSLAPVDGDEPLPWPTPLSLRPASPPRGRRPSPASTPSTRRLPLSPPPSPPTHRGRRADAHPSTTWWGGDARRLEDMMARLGLSDVEAGSPPPVSEEKKERERGEVERGRQRRWGEANHPSLSSSFTLPGRPPSPHYPFPSSHRPRPRPPPPSAAATGKPRVVVAAAAVRPRPPPSSPPSPCARAVAAPNGRGGGRKRRRRGSQHNRHQLQAHSTRRSRGCGRRPVEEAPPWPALRPPPAAPQPAPLPNPARPRHPSRPAPAAGWTGWTASSELTERERERRCKRGQRR